MVVSLRAYVSNPGDIIPRMLVCVVLACLMWTGPARSQERPPLRLDPDRQLTQYLHEAWRSEHGLPANTVAAILQDSKGYLWLGTQSGLVRFDGVSFRTYSDANTENLAANNITALEHDPGGGFWIGTQGGITHYENGAFTSYTSADGLLDNAVTDLYVENDSTLWVATNEGVSRFQSGSFMNLTEADGLPGKLVIAVTGGEEGTIWMGTDYGLWTWKNGELSSANSAQTMSETRVLDILSTTTGDLWIATLDGLYRRRGRSTARFTTDDGLSSRRIRSVYEDAEGTIWIGTVDGGLNRFDGFRFGSYDRTNALGEDKVRAIYQDREHSLWIGLEGAGLHQLRSSKFSRLTSQEALPGNDVSAILEDDSGTKWIGTDGSGLTEIDPNGRVRHHTSENGLPGNKIYALHQDSRGRLWVAVDKFGVCRRDGNRWTCIDDEDGLASNTVFNIYEDAENALWFGTNGGLTKYENGRLTTYMQDDGLPSQFIISIEEGPDGALWLGTCGDGLVRMNADESFDHFTTEDGLTGELILELILDERGDLWIASSPGGICRYRTGDFSCITTEEGLPSNDVLQLIEDGNGNFWAGTFNGIARVPKQHINDVADGARDSVEAEPFTTHDGLPDNEVNGGTEPAVWQMNDGGLWFATVGGVAIVDPNEIPINDVPPPAAIDPVLVQDEVRSLQDSTSLERGDRKLEFHFSALSLVRSGQIDFRYRLKGYETDWISASERRVAYYTNLAPGRYTFQVRAANTDGVWSEKNASLTLTIPPYFYETTWFYILSGIGVILLGLGGYRLRVRQLHAREEELSRIVEERTGELRKREQELEELNEDLEQEVERQLEIILAEREKVERKRIQLEERKRYEEKLIDAKEEAEESARLKSTILMNMSHEIRTPLTSILGFAEVLEEEIDGELLQFAQLIHKSGKRLLDTLNSVLDMSQLEANSMTIEASQVNVIEEIKETIDMMENRAREKDLYLRLEADGVDRPLSAHIDESFLNRIINSLVGNALKFTEEGGITVRVRTIEHDVLIDVADTGIGIDEDFLPQLFDAFKQESTGLRRSHEGTGLGLAITKRLVELMDGTIDVESERGEGTTFHIRFPRKVHELDAEPALETR